MLIYNTLGSITYKQRKTMKDYDFSSTAFGVVQEATDHVESEQEAKPLLSGDKNPNAVALGRLGGRKGGKARAAKLTPEQRIEIARKAARSRWGKDNK